MSKKRKPGRPKLPKDKVKGRAFQLRLTAKRIKAMQAAARAKGQTVSEWVRQKIDAALGKE